MPLPSEVVGQRFLGHWVGTSTTYPFADFTELDIFKKGTEHYMRRYEKKAQVPPEGVIEWNSRYGFDAFIPHWASQTKVHVRGVLHQDNEVLLLVVIFKNDGLIGLEELKVELRQDQDFYAKFMTLKGSRNSISGILNSTFPLGDPTDINMSREELDSTIEKMFAHRADLPDHQVDALFLLKDGKTIIEEYRWGMDNQELHMIASITKNIMSILAGIALDQEIFTLDDIVSEAFPEIESTWSQGKPVRVRHMLAMTSGTKFGRRETQALLGSECVEGLVLGADRLFDPGEKYHYDNGLSVLLAVFLEKKTGMSIETFGERYLFLPLGITKYRWTYFRQSAIDGQRLVLPSGGLYMTLPDLAKIGLLMLGKGIYGGHRVFSVRYSELCVQPQAPKDQYPYGLYWHLNIAFQHFSGFEDAFIAIGAGEQVICIIPSQKLVFVALSSSWKSRTLTPAILKTFSEVILNSLSISSHRSTIME